MVSMNRRPPLTGAVRNACCETATQIGEVDQINA
jgi:hypothetical protein